MGLQSDERSTPGHGREMMRDFIQQASPAADPANVLLFGLLLETRAHLVQAVERNLAAAGLSWAKLRLLMHLAGHEHIARHGGVQPSELSKMQDIGRNTVSALTNGLEAEGLVRRELHGSDRRRLLISLTPKGRQVLKSKLGDYLLFVSRQFDVLDRPQRDTLTHLLATLNGSVEEEGHSWRDE